MATIDQAADGDAASPRKHGTTGSVLNWGWFYDLVVWFFSQGKESRFREAIVDLAAIEPGEAVLDVGCGTGTLAVAAQQVAGDSGRVCGIDPGPRQIARARGKATRRGAAIEFVVGTAERLPYPDETFDVATTTLVLHHLPDELKPRALAEIARVLKPGGRILVVDVKTQADHPHHLGPRHGRSRMGTIDLHQLVALLEEAGFAQIASGPLPFTFRGWGHAHAELVFTRARLPIRSAASGPLAQS